VTRTNLAKAFRERF